jgi:phenylacetate-CoA ligase
LVAVYERLTPGVMLPLYDLLGRRRLWSQTRLLRRLQWRSPDELEARAAKRLNCLLEQAGRTVPYYRQLFRDSGFDPAAVRATADLARLPITTKTNLRAEFPNTVVAQGLPASRRQWMRTGGSTGLPLEFYADRQAHDVWLGTYFFFLGWLGTGLWHTVVRVTATQYIRVGHARPPVAPVRLARRVLLGERSINFTEIDLRVDQFLERTRCLGDGRPYFIRGYASQLAALAARLLESGATLPRAPRAVITHAETLTTHQATLIERAFDCRPTIQYSLWEVPQVAQSCPDAPGLLHVNNQRAVLRVVREDGAEAEPGQSGRVLITDLHNEVMPILNYDTGDLAVRGPACPCGRGFPTLERIEGRVGDQIVLPDGTRIGQPSLVAFLTWGCPVMPWVWEYQAIQTSPDQVVLRVVPAESYSTERADELRSWLATMFGGQIRVQVEPVATIEPEPNGKRPIIKVAYQP